MTVERVNFLEQERWVVNYLKVAWVFGGLLVICLLSFGVLMANGVRLQHNLDGLTRSIAELNVAREKILSSSDNQAAGLGPVGEIRTLLTKNPDWYRVFEDLSFQLPSEVWLSSAKTFEKPESPSGFAMVMSGRARTAEALSGFLARLRSSPYFAQTVLSQSKESNGLFEFSLESWVLAKAVR